MSSRMRPQAAYAEDHRVDHDDPRETESDHKVDRLRALPLEMLKAKVGGYIAQAIGERSDKEFGDKAFIGKVKTGDKVPEYLARIIEDRDTRRRLAFAMLESDDGVVIRYEVTVQKKAG